MNTNEIKHLGVGRPLWNIRIYTVRIKSTAAGSMWEVSLTVEALKKINNRITQSCNTI